MDATATRQWQSGERRTGSAAALAERTAITQAGSSPAERAAVLDRSARWGMALVLLLFGYEWLLSGLNKILSPDFRSGLAANLQDAMKDNPNGWYVGFLRHVVVPHTHFFAGLVEVGEVLVAVGLIAGAAFWLGADRLVGSRARTLHLGVCAALAGSAVMTANYYLMSGNTMPWLNPGNPFNEGLDLDGLLTLVALALLAIHLQALRLAARRPLSPRPRSGERLGVRENP